MEFAGRLRVLLGTSVFVPSLHAPIDTADATVRTTDPGAPLLDDQIATV